MKKFTGLLAGLMLFMTGCASCPEKGRLTLVSWDSREAEQLMAAQASDNVVWNNSSGENGSSIKAETSPRVFEWAALFAMIGQLKVRIQLVNIEWCSEK